MPVPTVAHRCQTTKCLMAQPNILRVACRLRQRWQMTESGDLEDRDLELPEEEEDEEGVIRYYFSRGFEYKEIRLFLFKNHGIEMNLSTLKRQIKQYGLRRQRPDCDIDDVRVVVQI